MAGNENFENEARQRKVASFLKAAEWTVETKAAADGTDPGLYTELLIERLAGRLGPQAALDGWEALRCVAKQLSGGINHGSPSDLTQAQVIGSLYRKLALETYYATQTDEQVFAGLSVVR